MADPAWKAVWEAALERRFQATEMLRLNKIFTTMRENPESLWTAEDQTVRLAIDRHLVETVPTDRRQVVKLALTTLGQSVAASLPVLIHRNNIGE